MTVSRIIEKHDFVVIILSGEISESELQDSAVWLNTYAENQTSKVTLMFVDDNFSMDMSAQRFVRVFALNPRLLFNLEINTVADYILRSFLSVVCKFNEQYEYCKWSRNTLKLTKKDAEIIRTLMLQASMLKVS